MTDLEKAVRFVMGFYNVSKNEAIELYLDEIEAYMRLLERGIEE